MQSTPLHSVSIAAVILDPTEENVLLIQRRDNGNWEPPGGVLELGESIDQGLRREVLEEVGVEITMGRLTGIYKNMVRAVVALVFRCEANGKVLRNSPEACEIAWVPLAKVEQLLTPAYAVRILDALQEAGPTVRSHDGVDLAEPASINVR